MNEKQQQLTFEKGITRAPSDAICSDNALEDEVGMIFYDGEHHVIQPPATIHMNVQTGLTLIFVHDNTEYQTGIFVDGNDEMYWRRIRPDIQAVGYDPNAFNPIYDDDNQTAAVCEGKITALGNTLIVTTDDGLKYYKWNGQGYTPLSSTFPEYQAKAYLKTNWTPDNRDKISLSTNIGSLGLDVSISDMKISDDKQDTWDDLVIGNFAKLRKQVKQEKGFMEPFFIRLALEMYDGTYTHISQPFLMIPAFKKNIVAYPNTNYLTIKKFYKLDMYAFYCHLLLRQDTDFTRYSDIIKDVVVFATEGIPLYDTHTKQPFELDTEHYVKSLTYNRIETYATKQNNAGNNFKQLKVLAERNQTEIQDDLASAGPYYKLCSIGLAPSNGDLSRKIETHTLENLTTQDRIDADDYFSRSKLVPNAMYAYNGRLNIADVKRSLFEGFDSCLQLYHYDNNEYIGTPTDFTAYITIRTENGDKIVKHEFRSAYQQSVYFFYPDSRAKHVMLYKEYEGSTCILDQPLTEHESLNGAYYFKGLPEDGDNDTAAAGTHTKPTSTYNDFRERLGNYIITSEVSNPFVFKARGYCAVGEGCVYDMATTTQAISQGQFGQFPLIAFTSQGIWALGIGVDGYFSTAHPLSREVLSGALLQVDSAIYFTSAKGLMVFSGNSVACVSKQMDGQGDAFLNFLANARMAYDYNESMVWIFPRPASSANYAYVFSMKSGTFARVMINGTFANGVESVVSCYPNYLIQESYGQGSGGGLYSFMTRSKDVNDKFSATLTTRPLKLENQLALKTITQVRHVMKIGSPSDPLAGYDGTSFVFKLYGSNTLVGEHGNPPEWTAITSLRGMPWRYYKMQYIFSGLGVNDTFAGTVLRTEERRTNKLR